MTFDRDLLELYRSLLQTTDLADAYGEFVRLFRFLRLQLEKELPDYVFQGNIAENAMDYSYFQCTTPALKSKGLKLAVVFVHRTFRLKVWLSGRSRAQQRRCTNSCATRPLSRPKTRPDRTTSCALPCRRTLTCPMETGWCKPCGTHWKPWPTP